MLRIAKIFVIYDKKDKSKYYISHTLGYVSNVIGTYRYNFKEGKKCKSTPVFEAVTGHPYGTKYLSSYNSTMEADLVVEILASFPYEFRKYLNSEISRIQSSFGK